MWTGKFRSRFTASNQSLLVPDYFGYYGLPQGRILATLEPPDELNKLNPPELRGLAL
jgi:hypothetical protein